MRIRPYFLQYISDVLDGAVGRYRDTGLVKWGFYMDHLLDYMFLASVIIGYSLIFTNIPWYWFIGVLALGGAFMVNMFLSFAATNEFRISVLKIGPKNISGKLIWIGKTAVSIRGWKHLLPEARRLQRPHWDLPVKLLDIGTGVYLRPDDVVHLRS